MRLETFATSALIAAVMITLGLTFMADQALTTFHHGYMDEKDFSNNDTLALYQKLQNFTETNVDAQQSGDRGQTDADLSTTDAVPWTKVKQAFDFATTVFGLSKDSEDAIIDIGGYLHVNSLIVSALVMFMLISLVVALVAFARGRRP